MLKHDDFVHDIQFDFYGKRIATCSSDKDVKIWERKVDIEPQDVDSKDSSNTNLWTCTQEIKGDHKGAIWRVAWADPEFGSIISSCGNDQ